MDDTPVYAASIVLDHRRRWRWFEDSWGEHHAHWIQTSRERVRQLWLGEYKPRSHLSQPSHLHQPTQLDAVQETILQPHQPTSPSPPPLSELMAYLDDSIQKCQEKPHGSITYDEYDKWTNEDVAPQDLHLNPFDYWLKPTVQSAYPNLARMALDILSIPPMSSEAERIFSLAGVTLCDNRQSIRDGLAEANELLADWDKRGYIRIGDRPDEGSNASNSNSTSNGDGSNTTDSNRTDTTATAHGTQMTINM
jgi:hypothetical protein